MRPRPRLAGRARRGAAAHSGPRREALALLLACALGAAAAGCLREESPGEDAPPAPALPRAATLLEPPRLRLGDTATLEVVVATPPEWQVRLPDPPGEVRGLWVLRAERPQLERAPQRWVHRARFTVRARESGAFTWPALEIEATGADGEVRVLRAPERPFEVAEVPPEETVSAAEWLRYREAGPGPAAHVLHPAVAALVGALAVLAGLGLVLLVRRVRRAESQPAAGVATLPGLGAAWRAAQERLGEAEAQAARAPIAAADAASSALRRLAARRLGRRELLSRTPDELALEPPPAALEAVWEELLGVLRGLDARRFAPPPRETEEAAEDADGGPDLRPLIGRARELAARLGPPGAAP